MTVKTDTTNTGVSEEVSDNLEINGEQEIGEELEIKPRLATIDRLNYMEQIALSAMEKEGPLEETDPLKEEHTVPETLEGDETIIDPSADEDELIVDGAKIKAKKSDIYEAGKRAMQKESAADKRLKEAAELKKELEEALKKAKSEPEHKPSVSTDASDAPDSEDELEIDADAIESIQMGSIDEAKTAIASILKKALAATRKAPTDVTGAVEAALRQRDEAQKAMMYEQIREKVKLPPDQGGFADLVEDKDLYSLYSNEVARQLAAGKPDVWETYELAGKAVRDKWINKTPAVPTEKVERKKGLVSVKAATGKQIKTTEETPMTEEEFRAQALAELRRSRGQGY